MTATTIEPRVRPVVAVRNTATLAWRTLVQIKHNPFELLDFSVQPIMFLVLFTYVFGGAIAGSTSEYLAFGLPGRIGDSLPRATPSRASKAPMATPAKPMPTSERNRRRS